VLVATFGPDAQAQASGKYAVQELPDLGGLAGAASINDLGWAGRVIPSIKPSCGTAGK